MRRVIVGGFVSLDGVMQAPGGPEEDTVGGFEYGGWTFPFWDEVMDKLKQSAYGLSGQLRLVLVQHQIDALPDVLGHGNLRLLVQRLEQLVLLRRDVDGGADLLSGHGDM